MSLKIYSGGQYGTDFLALEVAKECGLETGGTAPKGFRTERGNNYNLRKYGLVEHSSYRYEPRTEKNVVDSDATILFGNTKSPGSKQTIEFCDKHSKEYKENPTPEELVKFIKENDIKILNVAGNRESKLTTEQMNQYRNILRTTFKLLAEDGRI